MWGTRHLPQPSLPLVFREGLGHSCPCQCGPGLVAIPWRLKRKGGRKTSSQALCLGSIASDPVEYSSLANMFSGFVEKALKKKNQFLGDLWPLWQKVSTLGLGRGPGTSFSLLSKQVSRPAQSPVLGGLRQDAARTAASQSSKCSVRHKHRTVLDERPLRSLALYGDRGLWVEWSPVYQNRGVLRMANITQKEMGIQVALRGQKKMSNVPEQVLVSCLETHPHNPS